MEKREFIDGELIHPEISGIQKWSNRSINAIHVLGDIGESITGHTSATAGALYKTVRGFNRFSN